MNSKLKKQPKTFATISDVAKYAEVGKTSVSRYLNGEQDKLSEPLREKIAQAIAHLGYRPSHSARMLKAGHSKLIGLLLADVTNPYSIDVLQGIEHVCRREGYMLMVCNTDNRLDQQERYLEMLEDHRVDGIIVNTLGMESGHLGMLSRIDCPFVLVDRIDPTLSVDSVGLDNVRAAELACQHLVEKCYESLLVITQPLTIATRRERVEALQTFVSQHAGMSCEVVEMADMSDDKLTNPIRDFIASNRGMKKALFCTNGVATMCTAKALKQLDMHLGAQVGLLSIDDPDWAQLVGGGITAMRQPTRQIGETACERLIARIRGSEQPPQQIRLPAELIVRAST
ncbi:LacI family DNA-binding transcriptional regulator [Vibrio sp. CDRSL-10 TSBA]